MTDMTIRGDLVDDYQEFFAPASSDMIDGLIGQYQSERRIISEVAEYLSGDNFKLALNYFVDGSRDNSRGVSVPKFDADTGIKALNSSFWDRALRMTDVIDCMPQKRRDEWNDQIREFNTPDFEDEAVRATIGDLMAMRSKFFAERVDGIFRALSRSHVTNRPEGFGKRMIISRAITSYDTVDHSTAGYINDLRAIIAKFMGRDEPYYSATQAVISAARRSNGQWMLVDGGSLRIRIYNGVGTAHIEVHPEMAWRLNSVLASIYPAAIPSQHREKPKKQKKIKDFTLFDRPLPFFIINILSSLQPVKVFEGEGQQRSRRILTNTLTYTNIGYQEIDKATRREIERVMLAIGGTPAIGSKNPHWVFSYDPQTTMEAIICNGSIPDHRSHQFYPTPDRIAQDVAELAGIEAHHRCLEPSAGIGNLADAMGEQGCQSITCVEISDLHIKVLDGKGYYAQQADFLKWRDGLYDRICMNPPFSEGRWQAHLEHAASMLVDGGRLVAVLPASAKGKQVLDGLNLVWHKTYKGEFSGTSVEVVILVADKECVV